MELAIYIDFTGFFRNSGRMQEGVTNGPDFSPASDYFLPEKMQGIFY